MVLRTSLIVSTTPTDLPSCLNAEIVKIAMKAIETRGEFTVALSGGSLPGFLAEMKTSFGSLDPAFDKWHVILADERCVLLSDPESNLGTLNRELFSNIPIPKSQIHGINQSILEDSSSIATEYETIVRAVMAKSDGQLDLAVLGFGPDGHTCSLFPNHSLLLETGKWVASIDDSPKPPPRRITLTYPVLNEYTRHVVFCGAGSAKAPILEHIFETVESTTSPLSLSPSSSRIYNVTLKKPALLPCARVLPNSLGDDDNSSNYNTLTYVVDQEAVRGITLPEE